MADKAPQILNLNAVKRVYQNVLDEDEEGDEVVVCMQSTPAFRELLNEHVFALLSNAIVNARLSGRNTLWPDDLPDLGEEDGQD